MRRTDPRHFRRSPVSAAAPVTDALAPQIRKEDAKTKTYHHPAIEIMNVRGGVPKRSPVYGQHGKGEQDEYYASRGENDDVDFSGGSGRGFM